ncbi:hypothetical protein [Hymenobacter sp.]|jgi:YD repeat-containing protein|uniref:hypothetical protein n=1 Tax=Hymenobacter sp. TaxID=1898978 RepID=UPI002EDA2186
MFFYVTQSLLPVGPDAQLLRQPERKPPSHAAITWFYRVRLALLAFFVGCMSATAPVSAQPKSTADVPTPNAASLGEFGQVPVSFFNGLPSIAVPLYTFQYRDIVIPIELTYHAGGNRPDAYPGWVGLGWNLNAGGAITRIVNGRPDEVTVEEINAPIVVNIASPYPYPANFSPRSPLPYPTNQEYGYFFRSNTFERSDWGEEAFLRPYLTSNGNWNNEQSPYDGEADEFMFNAGDLSGSFFMCRDASNALKVKVKSKSGEYLKIEQTLSTAPLRLEVFKEINRFAYAYKGTPEVTLRRSFIGFAITRTDGTKYYFGGSLGAVDLNTALHGKDVCATLATSWLLTKIESPKGHAVDFHYKRKGDFFAKSTVRNRLVAVPSVSSNNNSVTSDNQVQYTLQSPSYLAKITAPDGSEVEFVSDRSYQLPYDYTPVGAATPPNAEKDIDILFRNLGNLAQWNPDYLNFNYLLQLNQIKVKGVRTISFNYVNNATQRLRLGSVEATNGAVAAPVKYQFAYNNNPNALFLPAYNSKQTDNWGFYNGKSLDNFNSNFPTSGQYNQDLFDYRAPDAVKMQAEQLHRITYPTGGWTTFEFEPHDYSKIARQYLFTLDNAPSSFTMAGGLRIRRITSFTSATDPHPRVREYSYVNENNTSSGVLSGLPVYWTKGYNSYEYWALYNKNFLFPDPDPKSVTQGLYIISEGTQAPLSSTNGNHVTYSRVVEKSPGNGYTVYKYTNTDTRSASNDLLYHDEDPVSSLGNFSSLVVRDPVTSRELERGLLLATEVYDEGSNLLRKTENSYNDDPNRYNEYVKNIRAVLFFGMRLPFVRATAYKVYTFYPSLKQRTETQYSRGSAPIVTTTTYEYNAYRLVSGQSTTDSQGQSLSTTYRYPPDIPYVGPDPLLPITRGIAVSVGKNMISEPVETVRYRNGLIVGGTLSLPATTNATPVPFQFLELELSGPLDPAQYTPASFTSSASNFIPLNVDGRYKLRQTIDNYDAAGNVRSITKTGQAPASYLWDYGKSLPVAVVQNAAPNQFAYAGFEADVPGQFINNAYVTFDPNNWEYDPRPGSITHLQTSGGFTGQGCYRLDGTWGVGRGNLPAGDYEVSFWAKGGSANVAVFVSQELSRSEGPANAQGYRLVRVRVRVNQGTGVSIDAYGREVDVDDVRLHPVGALMTTYTHTPQVGVTSVSDANNQPTRYDYDGLQRLKLVRNPQGNIIKALDYHFQQ